MFYPFDLGLRTESGNSSVISFLFATLGNRQRQCPKAGESKKEEIPVPLSEFLSNTGKEAEKISNN